MALKFFWIYIGSFLACSIALTVLVKKLAEGFAGSGKAPYVYGTFSSVLAAVAAYLSTFVSGNLFQVFWFMGGVFLLFGVIHVAFAHKRYFYAHRYNSQKVFSGEILFGLSVVLFTIVIFSSLQYFLREDRYFLFYPMVMSTLTFFVPLLVFHTFEAAYGIPSAEFFTWQYPMQEPIEIPEFLNERELVIGFEIAKKLSDNRKTYFRAKAPESMKLGELYYHFLNDYNDLHSETTIDYAENDYDAHEWWFRRKPKWYQGQRILDPNLSIRENGIKENTVIICERIQNLQLTQELVP